MTLTPFNATLINPSLAVGSHAYTFKVINNSGQYNLSNTSNFTFVNPAAITFSVSNLALVDPTDQYSSVKLDILCNVDIVGVSVSLSSSTHIPGNAYLYFANDPLVGMLLPAGLHTNLILSSQIKFDNSLLHDLHGSHPISVTVTDVAGHTQTISATLSIPSATMDGSRPGLAPELTLNALHTATALNSVDVSSMPDTTFEVYTSYIKLPQDHTRTFNTSYTVGATTDNFWMVCLEDRFTLEEEGNTFGLFPIAMGYTGINDVTLIHSGFGLREPTGLTVASFQDSFVSKLEFKVPGVSSTPLPEFTYGFFTSLAAIEAISLQYTNYSYVANNQGIDLKCSNKSHVTSVVVKNSDNLTLSSCTPSASIPNIYHGIILNLNTDNIMYYTFTNIMDANNLFITNFDNNVMTYSILTTYSDASTKTHSYIDPLSTWDFNIFYPKALLSVLAKPASMITYDYYKIKVIGDFIDAKAVNLAMPGIDEGYRGNYLIHAGQGYYENWGIPTTSYTIADVPDGFKIYSYDGHIKDENLYFNYNANLSGNGLMVNMVICSTIPGRVVMTYRINRLMQWATESTRFWDVTRRMVIDFTTDPILHHIRAIASVLYTNAYEIYIRCEKVTTLEITDGTSTMLIDEFGTTASADSRLAHLTFQWINNADEKIVILRGLYPDAYADGLFLSPTALTTFTVTATRVSDSATDTQSFDIYPRSTLTYGNDPTQLDIVYDLTASYDAGTHTTTYGVSVTGADASQVSLSQSEIYLYDAGSDNFRISVPLTSGAGTQDWTALSSTEYDGVLQQSIRAAHTGVHAVWIDLSRTRIKKSDGSFLHIPRISPKSTSSLNSITVANYTV